MTSSTWWKWAEFWDVSGCVNYVPGTSLDTVLLPLHGSRFSRLTRLNLSCRLRPLPTTPRELLWLPQPGLVVASSPGPSLCSRDTHTHKLSSEKHLFVVILLLSLAWLCDPLNPPACKVGDPRWAATSVGREQPLCVCVHMCECVWSSTRAERGRAKRFLLQVVQVSCPMSRRER